MRPLPQDDATQDDFDHNINERPPLNQHDGYKGHCAQILLPFGKSRDKFWYSCVTIVDLVWLLIFGIITFGTDDACPDVIKAYGEIIFGTYIAMILLNITLFVALNMYNENKTNLSFLTFGLITWISLIIMISFLTLFEMIATADWTFGYHDVGGCESLYYLIILNVFWLIILFSTRVAGPIIYMFWDWLTNKVLHLPRNEDY